MARGKFETVKPGLRRYTNAQGKVVSYSAWVTDSQGKMLWLPATKTLKESEAARSDYLSARGRNAAPSATTLTLTQLWTQFEGHLSGLVVAGDRRPATLRLFKQHWTNHLEKELGRVKLRDLSRSHVVDLGGSLRKKGLKPASIASVRAALSAALEYAISKNLVSINAVKMVKAPKAKSGSRALTPEEAAALIEHARDNWRLFIAVALNTGLRSGEIRGLQWKHFQGEGVLNVEHQWTAEKRIGPTKSEAGVRSIILPLHIALELKKHRLSSEFSGDTDFIFTTVTGQPRNANAFLKAVQASARRAGIAGKVTAHTLRHSYCSLLIHRGVDVVTVSNQAGHSRPSVTTDLYGHVNIDATKVEQLRAALA